MTLLYAQLGVLYFFISRFALNLRAISQVLYMLATVVALDYLHDTWFYWTHRLLHWQPLYRSVHHIHHQCATPALRWGSNPR